MFEVIAHYYGVETKRLNEQVKRNSSRFPDDFMFQLSVEECNNLRSQFATSSYSTNHSWGGRRVPPFVFTELGVALLLSFSLLFKTNLPAIPLSFRNLQD